MNTIDYNTNIGTSLSTINTNTSYLDSITYFLNLSSSSLFSPMYNYYLENRNSLLSLMTTVQTFSSNWLNLTTIVTTNSSRWIKPLIYIHPAIQQIPVQPYIIDAIITNFKNLHPLLNENGIPYYIQGQRAILYYYTYTTGSNYNVSYTQYSNTAYCVSCGDLSTQVVCYTRGTGSAKCEGHDTDCGICQSWQATPVHLSCRYAETNDYYSNRYTYANINSNFTDRYETDINAIQLIVDNCEWVFERNLV